MLLHICHLLDIIPSDGKIIHIGGKTMTVLKIGQKKLKITLTDSEVLSFFGAYERLNAATSETRLTVGLLLKESLSEYETELDGDLLVEIRARENAGCVITV